MQSSESGRGAKLIAHPWARLVEMTVSEETSKMQLKN